MPSAIQKPMEDATGERAVERTQSKGSECMRKFSDCMSNLQLPDRMARIVPTDSPSEFDGDAGQSLRPSSSFKSIFTMNDPGVLSVEQLKRQSDNELMLHSERSKSPNSGSSSTPDTNASCEHLQKPGKCELSSSETRLRFLGRCLCVWGVVPWQSSGVTSMMYQKLVALSVFAVFVIHMVTDCMYMTSVPVALGSFLGLLVVRTGRIQNLMIGYAGPLETYSNRHGITDMWANAALKRCMVVVAVWLCSIVLHLCSFVLVEVDAPGIPQGHLAKATYFLCFFLVSGIFVALVSCQLFVFSMLGIMIDHFCTQKFVDLPVSHAIADWNIIQAILRRATGAFDSCFLVTQTTALAVLLVSAVQLVQAPWVRHEIDLGHFHVLAAILLPPVLLALGAGGLFYTAATITEKCSRVPALLNSVMFNSRDELIDQKRQCLVQYITSSAAGFYIKEVRLSAGAALKLMYTIGLGGFAVLTKIAVDSQQSEQWGI
eukprot:gnl/TRDRNA2_/TRDRNA2_176030_c0_seq1.p1 gnl/TRDRNA2_/TRDRNA2_176030_c0~~gnl/TRDRNA2_/TRDRNA2_176030_c0_seq1.p1  ORF type:complete len:488 (+),score=50.90 gnl/TRDRNA2_/TRDRNA2_176030_c0_seq1:3-1466(+)